MPPAPTPQQPKDRRAPDDRREDRRRPRAGRRITDLATHPDSWLLVPAIAEYLSVNYKTVDKWIDAGLLRAYDFDGCWRVRRDDLEAFIARHEYQVPSATVSSAARR